MKKIELRLNGKPFEIDITPAIVKRVLAFLSKAEPDALYDSVELAKTVGCVRATIQDNGAYLKEFIQRVPSPTGGHRNVYGSKAAIAELKKQLGAV